MAYSKEKIEAKIKKLLRLYKKDLTIDDFFELVPQEMEIAEISNNQELTGQEKHDLVVAVLEGVIDQAAINWIDKDHLKQIIPFIITTIAKGSRQHYAINRSDD